jgi:uncharacterized protein with NRDE domain
MCTVVFIPKGGKYYFASLRDENPLRPNAMAPCIHKLGKAHIVSPVDSMAGGTWIGVTDRGSSIILLNGGYDKHERKLPYLKSRGLIVTELLVAGLPIEHWNMMDMQHVEPYTLVVFQEGNLFELVWDGEKKCQRKLNPDLPYIWSSATLYNQQAKQNRKALFQGWLRMNIPVSSASLFDFFKSYTDRENGFLINRNDQIRTLSYTFIEVIKGNSAKMDYHDLSENTIDNTKPLNKVSTHLYFRTNDANIFETKL